MGRGSCVPGGILWPERSVLRPVTTDPRSHRHMPCGRPLARKPRLPRAHPHWPQWQPKSPFAVPCHRRMAPRSAWQPDLTVSKRPGACPAYPEGELPTPALIPSSPRPGPRKQHPPRPSLGAAGAGAGELAHLGHRAGRIYCPLEKGESRGSDWCCPAQEDPGPGLCCSRGHGWPTCSAFAKNQAQATPCTFAARHPLPAHRP